MNNIELLSNNFDPESNIEGDMEFAMHEAIEEVFEENKNSILKNFLNIIVTATKKFLSKLKFWN